LPKITGVSKEIGVGKNEKKKGAKGAYLKKHKYATLNFMTVFTSNVKGW